MAEEGRTRSRLSYIGPDQDYEEEVLDEMGLGNIEAQESDESGVSVDACAAADEPDSFLDWEGISHDVSDHDDPHEDLLQRIGALSSRGKR